MKRVQTKVCDAEARKRLEEYRMSHGAGPYRAATLAGVIWTDVDWIAEQGAGAAASRVLKRLGCYWTVSDGNWGWMLRFPNEKSGCQIRRSRVLEETNNRHGKSGK